MIAATARRYVEGGCAANARSPSDAADVQTCLALRTVQADVLEADMPRYSGLRHAFTLQTPLKFKCRRFGLKAHLGSVRDRLSLETTPSVISDRFFRR